MRPTRKIVVEFIGVFIVGIGAGGLLTWGYFAPEVPDQQITDLRPAPAQSSETTISAFMSRSNHPDTLVARINKKYADEYHLTPDELNRIQPLVNDMAQNIYKVRHQFGLDIMATLDDSHQKIAAQLTPDHRAAYEKAVAERRAQLAALLLDESSPTVGAK